MNFLKKLESGITPDNIGSVKKLTDELIVSSKEILNGYKEVTHSHELHYPGVVMN